MTPDDIVARIDRDACLSLLSRMAQHKSYSQTPGERELAGFMADQMRALGLDAELTPVPGDRVNAVGRLKGTGGGASLLFNGHVDTNPVTEGWTVDPWGGLVDDRFIYGIGVSNMKAGDAAYFCAVRTLIEAGVRLRGDSACTPAAPARTLIRGLLSGPEPDHTGRLIVESGTRPVSDGGRRRRGRRARHGCSAGPNARRRARRRR